MSDPKRLFILRHGTAESINFQKDEERELTVKGFSQAIRAGKHFASLNIKLDAIYASPLVRAQQTAQNFKKQLRYETVLETSDLITPSGRPIDVALWLSNLPTKNVLLVTHQPFAQQLVELLSDAPLPADFSMNTGTMIWLEGEVFATDCCQFIESYTPKTN